MRLRYLQLARADLHEAATWYEQRKEGLGRQFVLAVRTAVTRVLENPELYQELSGGVRRAPVASSFPHQLFYRCTRNDTIDILAVLNPARDPAVWKARR